MGYLKPQWILSRFSEFFCTAEIPESGLPGRPSKRKVVPIQKTTTN